MPALAPDSAAFDVAVVGAGPTGLAAALFAARLERRTALIGPPAQRDWRTAALMSGSIAFLDRIGAWPRLEPEAAPLRRIRIVDGSSHLIRAPEVVFDSSEIGLEAFGHNIPNAALDDALAACVAESGIVRIAAKVTRVEPGEQAVALTAEDGTALTAQLVVAADGRHSPTRDAAGIGTREWNYSQAALVANLRHELPHGDCSTEFHTETGPFTLVPLPGRRASLVWVQNPIEAGRLAALPSADLAYAIEARAHSILGHFEIEGDRQVFPLSGLAAERLANNRIALVGEAAHRVPPIGAQGLNLGLRDVAALATAFAVADPGAPAVLAGYDRMRTADVTARLGIVDSMNRSLLTDFLPVQAARGLGLFMLDRLPGLRKLVMRQGVDAA